jgi:hypothetical protein
MAWFHIQNFARGGQRKFTKFSQRAVDIPAEFGDGNFLEALPLESVPSIIMFKYVYSDTVYSGRQVLLLYIEHRAHVCGYSNGHHSLWEVH